MTSSTKRQTPLSHRPFSLMLQKPFVRSKFECKCSRVNQMCAAKAQLAHYIISHVRIQVLKDSVIPSEHSCERRLIMYALTYSGLSDKDTHSLITVPRPGWDSIESSPWTSRTRSSILARPSPPLP